MYVVRKPIIDFKYQFNKYVAAAAAVNVHQVKLRCVSMGLLFCSQFAIDFQLLSLRETSCINKSEPQTAARTSNNPWGLSDKQGICIPL
jgi:hypothetical protein